MSRPVHAGIIGAGIEGHGEDLADPFLDDRSFRAWRTSEEQTIDPLI
jgi:hypothetical protein